MEWFQYKPGIVVDSLRVAHQAAPTSVADLVQAWCRQKFHPGQIEETSAPNEAPEPGKPTPGVPCFVCLLGSTAADVDGATSSSLELFQSPSQRLTHHDAYERDH